MRRYIVMGGNIEGFYVYDQGMVRAVPGTSKLAEAEAFGIANVLNQRVERPELTRADGKLVTVF